MGRISLESFQHATSFSKESAELRLGRNDGGQLKTAKHGFFGRLVRQLFGPTKQDRADNQKIMNDFFHGLKKKYGDDLGTQAFLKAVPQATFNGEHVNAPVDKPLTARQVRAAQWDIVWANEDKAKAS